MQWILSSLVVLLISTDTAYAYLDPGTGSFILQMLLAGGLAAAASFKLFWQRIKGVWLKLVSGAGVQERK